MVGIKKSKLILGIFIPILAFFLMSHNTFAIEYGPAEFGLRYRSYNSATYDWQLGLYAGPNYSVSAYGLNGVRIQWQNMTFQGNHASIHSEINVVAWEPTNIRRNNWVNLPYQGIMTCASNAGSVKVEQSNVSSVITNWIASDSSLRSTLTFYVDVALSGLNQNGTGYIACLIGSNSYAFASDNTTTGVKYYVEQAPSRIEFSNNINDVLLQTQINQNETMIYNQNMMIDQNKQINTNIVEGFDNIQNENQEAYDNISGQSSSDIDGATNNQTVSLINVITGFINAFSGISATNCNLTLDFPSYVGGSRVVNICSGKDKAPRIVEIGSSLLLICVFVPLAFVLIRMIYNEIRSWTNG